jgi:hypothetical protein
MTYQSSSPFVRVQRQGIAGGGVLPSGFETRLLSFQRSYNWDAAGAKAIRESTCVRAVDVVRMIADVFPHIPMPRPAPATSGHIALYWKNGNRHLTIYVTPGQESLFVRRKQAGGAPAFCPVTMGQAVAEVRDLYV